MAEGKYSKDEKFEKYDPSYKKLVGETFQGTYVKTLSRADYILEGDPKARRWKMVSFDRRTFKRMMKEDLDHILTAFEGKIWKGVHEGRFYVNPDTVQPELFVEGAKKKYKIEKFERFHFTESKTGDKYSDRCGYFFTLGAAN